MPRLILFSAERASGRWHFTIGFHWPCGCTYAGTAYTPWKAAKRGLRAHV